MENKIQIQTLTEKNVAFVSFKGNYIGNKEVFKGLFNKLCGWAGPKGLLGENVEMLSSYQDDPKTTPPEELRVEVCLVVPDNTEVEGEVQKKTLPGGEYAVGNFTAKSPEEYGPAWEEVVSWIENSDYQIDMSRPSYEIYRNNPDEHPEKHHIFDICMSVKSK